MRKKNDVVYEFKLEDLVFTKVINVRNYFKISVWDYDKSNIKNPRYKDHFYYIDIQLATRKAEAIGIILLKLVLSRVSGKKTDYLKRLIRQELI